MTLRQRIVLALAPLMCLLTLIGATGIVLLRQVGDRIEDILRENYISIEAMRDLNESLERIDSSFQFALQGKEDVKKEYDANWRSYQEHLHREENNITLPGEAEKVGQLQRLTLAYREAGDRFFSTSVNQKARSEMYFGGKDKRGLLFLFRNIKAVSGDILRMNEYSMKQADAEAKQTAMISQVWLGVGLAATVAIATLLIWWITRSVLRPIQAVTQSAIAIGAGNFNQSVPIISSD